jgi:hypothetical protein
MSQDARRSPVIRQALCLTPGVGTVPTMPRIKAPDPEGARQCLAALRVSNTELFEIDLEAVRYGFDSRSHYLRQLIDMGRRLYAEGGGPAPDPALIHGPGNLDFRVSDRWRGVSTDRIKLIADARRQREELAPTE